MFTTLASEQRELLGAGCAKAQGITAPQGPTAAPGCALLQAVLTYTALLYEPGESGKRHLSGQGS